MYGNQGLEKDRGKCRGQGQAAGGAWAASGKQRTFRAHLSMSSLGVLGLALAGPVIWLLGNKLSVSHSGY